MGNKDSSLAASNGINDSENAGKSLLPQPSGIVREHISSTAVDSIRDSQQTGNELAKANIMEVLKDKKSIIQFGELLSYSFSYESVLKPTRDLIYWSIQTEDSLKSLAHVSQSGIEDWSKSRGKIDLTPPIKQWVLSRETRIVTINPLLTWTLREKSLSLEPLAVAVIDVLPYTKETTVENMKYWALEGLKSEDVKKIAKDGLVHMLRKTAGGLSEDSSNGNSKGT